MERCPDCCTSTSDGAEMSWTKPSSEEILARAAASAETLRAIYEGASSGSDSETEDDEDDEDLSKLEELILKSELVLGRVGLIG